MLRKVRSDCTLGTFAKKRGISELLFRHPNGRKIRRDKRIGTMRKEGFFIW